MIESVSDFLAKEWAKVYGEKPTIPKTTQSTEELLAEREKTHGSFEIHAEVTQRLKRVLSEYKKNRMHVEHLEALDMILHKIGRIVAGNPHVQDHWADIAGYAKLGERACEGEPT